MLGNGIFTNAEPQNHLTDIGKIVKNPKCKICKKPMLLITKSPSCDYSGNKGDYYNHRCEKCDEETLTYEAQKERRVHRPEEVSTATPGP